MGKCKICGQDIHTDCSVINPEGDKLYVVSVDNVLYLLCTDDTLCTVCAKKVVWYKRQG